MEDDDDHRPTTAMSAAQAEAGAEDAAFTASDDVTVADTRLGPGDEVGGYIIDGEIGKGGMGHVYSATHPVIGKRAAIKVLKPEVSKQPVVVERFIQEARAVNRIGHPSIIDIFAFGTLPDGRAYHIMDLLEGESLRKRVKRGPLHVSETAAIIGDIASALSAAHEKGFIHRDLKPDNVFLVQRADSWPEVKLLDFGLAKLMPEAGVSPFITKTGVMLGTPEYMSPEQARGVGVDYRTDIYALGILTFELLARQRPFPSLGDPFATMQAHIEELPPSLRDLVPGLPAEMVQLVEAMLAKDPAARPSLAAVRNVIKRLRTTQLPTRTEAGLEMSIPPVAARVEGLPPTTPRRTSGLADAPVVDDDAARTVQNMRRASKPPPAEPDEASWEALPSTSPQRPKRTLSHPPVDGPKPDAGSQPSLPGGIAPVPSYQSMHYSHQGAPAPAPLGPPSQAGVDNVPSYQSMHVGSAPSLPASGLVAPGLRPSSSPIPATKLGVKPVKVVTAPAASRPAPAKSSSLWIVIGALVAIGLGIGLALAIMS